MENQDKLLQYIATCRANEIELCPPDVNAGHPHFSVKDNKILYGLAAIKNVGRDAVAEIVAEREANGPFSSLLDFTSRVNMIHSAGPRPPETGHGNSLANPSVSRALR